MPLSISILSILKSSRHSILHSEIQFLPRQITSQIKDIIRYQTTFTPKNSYPQSSYLNTYIYALSNQNNITVLLSSIPTPPHQHSPTLIFITLNYLHIISSLYHIILQHMNYQSADVNLLPIAEEYFKNMFTEIPGMKALVLDFETIGIISIIFSQSKLFKNDVYLIQRITDKGQKMQHLKAVYFVRPTDQNFKMIIAQLKDPKYMEYYLFFTNEIQPQTIKELAENDTADKIKALQEVYLDFFALARNIFTLNIPSTIGLNKSMDLWKQEQKTLINRTYQGILSVLMSLRVIPTVRYLSSSDGCKTIANKLAHKLQLEYAQKKSDYRINENAILILTERREDVVTPLLIPWTYQAMIHQFLGIANNKVDIVNRQKRIVISANDPIVPPNDKSQFVLSQIEDQFYRNNLFKTFGDLATNIKRFIDDVGKKRNKAITIESLEDMHSALDMMPQLSQISANVSKHVTLSEEISKQITKSKSMEVSQTEQNLICQDSRKDAVESIWRMLKNPNIQSFDKLKMVLLFSVKYPSDKQMIEFSKYLSEIIGDKRMLSLPRTLQLYQTKRKSDLFHNSNITKKAKSFFKDILFKDVPNVYTQHKCYLFEALLPDILSGRVKDSEYPVAYEGSDAKGSGKPLVIIFQLGGTTFAQSHEAMQFKDARVVIGGNFVHNSRSFLAQVIQMSAQERDQ